MNKRPKVVTCGVCGWSEEVGGPTPDLTATMLLVEHSLTHDTPEQVAKEEKRIRETQNNPDGWYG